MATLGAGSGITEKGTSSSIIFNGAAASLDPPLELVSGYLDFSFVYTDVNASGTYTADVPFNFPSDFINPASATSLSVQLRYHAATALTNAWNSLTVQLYNDAVTVALSNVVTIASNITTLTPTNSAVIAFTGLNTSQTDPSVWQNARLRITWTITKSMGGDTSQKRVTAATITGTYFPQAFFDKALTAVATASATLTIDPLSLNLVGTATGSSAVSLPNYEADDLIIGTAYRDGSATAPTVPGGWTTHQTANTTNSSAVLVSKVASVAQSEGTFTGWTQRTLPANELWQAATFGNGRFVAVGASTTISLSSTDGINWTQGTITSDQYWGIAYGNGTFVTVSDNFSTQAATSPDGITWTNRSLPSAQQWRAIAYGNGTFVAIANGTSIAATSPDGISWTQQTLPLSGSWYTITFGNGKFVAVGYNASVAITSPDGVTWTQQTMPVSSSWFSATYGGGKFVAVASGTAIAATSLDGINWTQQTLPGTWSWRAVKYGAGLFVATTSGPNNVSATSQDGISWTERTLPETGTWYALAYGIDKFVVLGQNSTKLATSDAATSSGTFTNATSTAFAIYRHATGVGNSTFSTGTGTTVNVPAVTFTNPNNLPFAVNVIGTRSNDAVVPSTDGGGNAYKVTSEVDEDTVAIFDSGGAII